MQDTEKKVSVYSIMNRWLYDGSMSTALPSEVESDKSISHMYLLYYFRASPVGLVIDKLMNNWGIFNLDRNEVLLFLKQCISASGYKPPFIQKIPTKKNKLFYILKEKYPFLKSNEISMLIEFVDQSSEKDQIYEMFGLYSPTKKKQTKVQQQQFYSKVSEIKKEVTLDGLMENFDD
jgi:hypothetical protein